MQDRLRRQVERELRGSLTAEEAAWLEEANSADLALGTAIAKDLAVQVRAVRQRVQTGQRRQPVAQVIENTTAALHPDHDAVRMRAVAVSMLIAQEARSDEEFVAFRKEVLHGRVIPWSELEKWLRTRARTELLTGENTRQPDELLAYATPDERWEHRVPVRPDGSLGRLKAVAALLARRYGISEAQAVVLLVSDLPPLIEPLKWSVEVAR